MCHVLLKPGHPQHAGLNVYPEVPIPDYFCLRPFTELVYCKNRWCFSLCEGVLDFRCLPLQLSTTNAPLPHIPPPPHRGPISVFSWKWPQLQPEVDTVKNDPHNMVDQVGRKSITSEALIMCLSFTLICPTWL